MSRTDGERQRLLPYAEDVQQSFKSSWDQFADFALSDNVLEVAVGLILAAAFTAVVNSFVNDILIPPISLLPFLSQNLDEKFAVLKKGNGRVGGGYNTPKQARDDGAVVMVYGAFLSKVINFLTVAFALFAVAKFYGWAASDNVIKRQVKCKYCRKRISEKAKRCVNCTSWQDGREG